MGIPDDLTCHLRNLYSGQEVTEPNIKQQTGSKLGKEYSRAVRCHLAYFTFIQGTSCETMCWMNPRLESRLWEKYQQPQMCRCCHSNGRKQRRTKEPLNVGESGEWKSWLKTQHRKTKNKDHGIHFHYFITSRWGKSGNSHRFYFNGLQNHCRWLWKPWN